MKSTSLQRFEWTEAVRIRSFHSNLLVSDMKLVKSWQPTLTDISSTDFCGGSVQLVSNGMGTVSSAASAPDIEDSLTRSYIARQAPQKTVLAIEVTPSGLI